MSITAATGTAEVSDDTLDPRPCMCDLAALDPSTMDEAQLRGALTDIEGVRSGLAGTEADIYSALEDKTSAHDAEAAIRRGQRVSGRTARRRAKTAQHLSANPGTKAALVAGEISQEHADALADAEATHEGAADVLLPRAKSQGPDRFRDTVRRYLRRVDGDEGDSAATKQFRHRRGTVFTRTDDNMGVHVFELDPVTHEAVIRALAYWVRRLTNDVTGDGDIHADLALLKRTGRQLLADAYAAMASASLRAGERGESAAPMARVLLIADYDAVTRSLTGRLPNGTSLAPSTVRRLACDADILPGVFRGPNQPLNLGREHRLVSPAQRAALEVRDGGCRGCGAHPAFCHAHHIIHWVDHGPTDIDNLVLLCTSCHHLVHEGDHEVYTVSDGGFALRRRRRPHPNDPHPFLVQKWIAENEPATPVPHGQDLAEEMAVATLEHHRRRAPRASDDHVRGLRHRRRHRSADDDGDGHAW